ncbi:hypothetical protein BC830DRAFT_1165737 [Chytriomyces sp. MP71]|nr:hypothetical protein BC830DRAFT_1165737 [Chytriomyces sp. MP71]
MAYTAAKDDRFFTHDWCIRVAWTPNSSAQAGCLLVKKVTESNARDCINAHFGTATAAEKDVRLQNLLTRCANAKIYRNALQVLAYLEQEPGFKPVLVGLGGVMEIPSSIATSSTANVGLELEPHARGRGLGVLLFRVLLRLAHELHVDTIEAGTMKENHAMRALAKKLGLAETMENKYHPNGSGTVVADVMFHNIGVHTMFEDGAFEGMDVAFSPDSSQQLS